jgi:glucokinase
MKRPKRPRRMTKDLETEQKYSRTAYADGPRLLADIGATHARFALDTAPGASQTGAAC